MLIVRLFFYEGLAETERAVESVESNFKEDKVKLVYTHGESKTFEGVRGTKVSQEIAEGGLD